MIIINLIGWLIFGLIIGVIAKLITPGQDPSGWTKTICIGIVGSYFGGILKTVLFGSENFSPSGFLFSIIGSVVFLFIWRRVSEK